MSLPRPVYPGSTLMVTREFRTEVGQVVGGERIEVRNRGVMIWSGTAGVRRDSDAWSGVRTAGLNWLRGRGT